MDYRRIAVFFSFLLFLLAPVYLAAAQKGFLQVNVSVEADVYVNDRLMGSTGPGRALNIKRGFPVGTIKVRVEPEGRPSRSKSYRITANNWTQAIFDYGKEAPASAKPTPPPTRFNEPSRTPSSGYSRSTGSGRTDLNVLLRTCHRHFDANRLTTPKGDNAAECYRQVLDRDPGNSTALSGMRGIERKYGQWADKAIDKGDLKKARSFVSRLESAIPTSPSVSRLGAAIAEAEQRQSSRYTPPAYTPQTDTSSPVRIEVSPAAPVNRRHAPNAAASAPVWQEPTPPAPQPRSGWQSPDARSQQQAASMSGWQNPDGHSPRQGAPVTQAPSSPPPTQPKFRATAADVSTIEMIRIPGGCYTMGSPPTEQGRQPNEKQHRACVEDFDLGKYEVSIVEFLLFIRETGYQTDAERNTSPGRGCFSMDANGRHSYVAGRNWRDPGFGQNETHPVVCVSWRDAMAYLDWLNSRTGQNFRLPTEAEWEYAARAEDTGPNPWQMMSWNACRYGDLADKRGQSQIRMAAHQCDDGFVHTAPVGKFTPNVYGLHDMMSNVAEWTCSAYSESYRGPENNCAAVGDGGYRVHRGASWISDPTQNRFAARAGQHSGGRFDSIGFRLARSVSGRR